MNSGQSSSRDLQLICSSCGCPWLPGDDAACMGREATPVNTIELAQQRDRYRALALDAVDRLEVHAALAAQDLRARLIGEAER